MKLLTGLASYLAVIAVLFGGLIGGVLWIVRPDPNAAPAPQRVAPIAPRIAESIARKMAAVPVTAANASEAAAEPAPAMPVMHVAPAALTPAPRVHIRELKPPHMVKQKATREPRAVAAQQPPPAAETPAPRPIATARTDSPY